MGNSCSPCGRKNPQNSQNAPGESKDFEMLNPRPEVFDERHTHQLIYDLKMYHKNRLRDQLEDEEKLHMFILDNLLLCIQFFDNFEKAVEDAHKYKRIKEKKMTNSLARDPHDGLILGDRQVKLLTGMSHVLAKNYIFKGQNVSDEEDVDMYYGGVGFKDTFMAEGILPLEFLMTWDNLEVHDESEFRNLKDYSQVDEETPKSRFCMEQPLKKTTFREGYVRLRCVDETIPFVDNQSERFEDAVYSKPYSHIPGTISESASPPTSDEDEDLRKLPGFDRNARFSSSKNKVALLDAIAENQNRQSLKSNLSTKNGFVASRSRLQNPPKLQITNGVPTLMVHSATPPVRGVSFMAHPGDSLKSSGRLLPPSRPGSNRNLNSSSKSNSNLTNLSRDSPGKETSSGYDTTSTRSMTSSMVNSELSEMMRDKWQKLNLKKLWEFGKKTRRNEIPSKGSYNPIPPNSVTEVKYETTYDDPEDEDEDADIIDESDSDSPDEGLELTHKRRKKRRNVEEDYEMRLYLNSLQMSSHFCSEFQVLGPKMNIPPHSMTDAVVLGTTIRLPIPYTYPKDADDEDPSTVGNYYVAHSYTPALHRKSWPSKIYFHFNQKIFSKNRHSSQGDLWPTRAQMEQIEELGCNAIPLGYRSVDFFNAEQFLEWELNFQDCETVLLNSFKNSHWRVYIFTAILARAFIAPLGPRGFGHDHIRNVLYFLCHQEGYAGWNVEEPGLHLTKLLDTLNKYLSRGNMPSFFVRSRNLLQSIPEENIRYVQGHLSRIRENPILYCIYAFRNLMNIRRNKESYSFPNLKSLYEMLTVEDAELLKIVNPTLRIQKNEEEEEQRSLERKKARKKRVQKPNLIDQQDALDKKGLNGTQEPPPKKDRVQEILRHRHQKDQEKRLKEKDERLRGREVEKLKQNPELRLPEGEKRKSIDLTKNPVIPKHFTTFRLLLVMQFFIEHFLKMAKRATEVHSYEQATMFVFQVQNLCEIAEESRYKEALPPFDDDELANYKAEALALQRMIGRDVQQYALSRLPSKENTRSHSFSSLPTLPISPVAPAPMANMPPFTNNWDLRRQQPPPPAFTSSRDYRPTGRTLNRPSMANSFQSLNRFTPASSAYGMQGRQGRPPSFPSIPIMDDARGNNRAPRRQESIRFVSPAMSGYNHRVSSASPTPPPQNRLNNRRQSPRDAPTSYNMPTGRNNLPSGRNNGLSGFMIYS